MKIAELFDIAGRNTHFSYIPYSSTPGDYNALQWFNNSVVKNIQSQDKVSQKVYLEAVIKRDPSPEGVLRGKNCSENQVL